MPETENGYVTLNVGMYSNLVVPVGQSIGQAVAWLALELDVPEDVLMAKLVDSVSGTSAPAPSNGASRPAQRRSAPAQRRSGGRGSATHEYPVRMLCPKEGHGRAELTPSIRNKDMDWDADLGMEIPASWYHKASDGKSCSVYRSQAEIEYLAMTAGGDDEPF